MKNAIVGSSSDRGKPHEGTKCEFCRNFHEFVLPDHLLDELRHGKVVIFAGAGISTEVRTVVPRTFYEEIHAALGFDSKANPPFPVLMSSFCKRPDGRRKMLELLKGRLSYIASFPELLRAATRFHREISTLFYIDTYITTNWDDYFERYCGATPFVTADDFAFWEMPGRKVFKIHGSVSNYGSIVATDEDYRLTRTRLQRGAIGSALKLLLATKTIVYIGYSLSDYDFLSIQKYIILELGPIAPTAYIVSLERSGEGRFRELGLIPIFTDATYFIQVVKKHLEKDGCLLPDSHLEGIPQVLARVRREHERLFDRFRLKRKPEILFAAFYQDGLQHAFERMLAMAHTGAYSHLCELAKQLRNYDKIKKENLSKRRYEDVAYVEGYMNGLLCLACDSKGRKEMPLYFCFGVPDIRNLREYRKALARKQRHRASVLRAEKLAGVELSPRDVLHHRAFL